MDKFDAEELEGWREHPVTVTLLRELRKNRAEVLEDVAGIAASGGLEARVRSGGGMAHAYAQVIRLIETKGKTS